MSAGSMSPYGEQRIRDIYEAALTKPPGERASFVARVAGADTDLRDRVEALLSGQQDTVLPGYESESDQAEQLLSVGTQINSYRIEGPLGAGGMGVVYFATDTKLNRPAAVKVLPEDLADPEARRRFQREAQMVSSLNHPHILTVYDAGEYQGREYLITEYVDGGTLRQWSARPRGWRAIVELLVGVADGIAVAHEAGILHRDIKPENILLAKNGYAKLADFGIAKLLETDPLAEDAGVPRGGEQSTHLGTLAYMSPEQWLGLPLDQRSDVYSFGLVLHELLAGRRLEVPDPTLPRKLPSLPPEVPAELRTLVAKALEPEPADRYQTMRELVVDLRRVARHSDVGVVRVQPIWRRPLVYVASALALLIVAVVVRDYVRGELDAGAARNAIAVLPFVNETDIADDLQIAEHLSDDLRERLMALPGLSVQARASSVSFEGQKIDLRTIAKTLGVGRLINARFRRQGHTLDVLVEILDEKGFAVRPPLRFSRQDSQLLALQQEIAQGVGRYLVPASSTTTNTTQVAPTAENELANLLVGLGDHLEHQVKDELVIDVAKLQEAIDYYRRATVADPTSISAYSHVAAALLYLGDVPAATAPLEKLFDLVRLAQAGNASTKPADLSNAYYTLALYRLRQRAPEADQAFAEAIRLNPNNADALGAYAQWLMTHIYVDSANHATIDRYFREAIDHDRQQLSRYVDYAEYLGTPPGDMSELRALALEIERRFPDERGYLKLARVYELTGDIDVGIAYGLKGYRLLTQSGESASEQLAEEARWQITELYARIGEFDKASEFQPEPDIDQLFFRRKYEDLLTVAGEAAIDDPNDALVYVYLAFAYNATGDFKNAQELLERQFNYPREFYSGGWEEVLPDAIYRDAVLRVGQDVELVKRVKDDAASFVMAFDRGMRKGFEHTWYMNVFLACAQAQLGRVPDALDSLDRVKNAEGLVWSPLIEDSPCFKAVADQPRYAELVEHLEERQRILRERLPATLREYGVEDVQP